MRNTAYALVLASVGIGFGCGDGGNDDTTTTLTTATTATMPATTQQTDPGTDSASGTTEPTEAGSVSDSHDTTGPTPTSTTVDPSTSTTNPITSTDSTATSTGPDTISDPSTDPGTTDGTTTTGETTTGGTTSTTTGGESTSTGDDTTTGDTTTGEAPCVKQEATLTPITPNIMLVLDKSGSMLTKWDSDANANTPTVTRWQSLHETVSAVLNKFAATINFGANLFPSKTATNEYTVAACSVQSNVEVKVKPNNGAAILSAIPGPGDVTLKGGTPAAAGIAKALAHLKTLPPSIPRAILFITDGAANCASDAGNDQFKRFETYDDKLNSAVADAYTIDSVPTYVVGIDIVNALSDAANDGNPNNTNTFTQLNDVATKGGKPKADPNEKFYNANNQIELSAALDAIIADAISCEIPLDSEPAKPELTEVEISGMEIPFVPNCNGMNGWTWTNPNGPYDGVKLCGTACTKLKMVGKADVNFFCVPN